MAETAPQPYTQPHQFEPLLPQSGLEAMRERARAIAAHSSQLGTAAHPDTIASLRELVREMKSYYSNRIEGQGTHPRNIARALRRDFSDKPDIARLQRLALAHIEAERALEAVVAGGAAPLTSDFVRLAHHELYSRLEAADRLTPEGRVIEPGRWRDDRREVGRHEPPLPEALPAFLARFDEFYGKDAAREEPLVAIAAAHQRMAWIHPFIDGNGRACRLQTHSALWPMSQGLWSVSRGLARRRDEYYERLDAADSPRQGDLDGRGNLSERELRGWCDWFLGICDDQVSFMAGLLALGGMKKRIEALVTFRAAHDKQVRMEAVLPLYHLFLAGTTPRGEFQQMTGLESRTARKLLSRLIETGLVTSESHVAPVRLAFPLDSLQFLLPGLYPEADAPET